MCSSGSVIVCSCLSSERGAHSGLFVTCLAICLSAFLICVRCALAVMLGVGAGAGVAMSMLCVASCARLPPQAHEAGD
jgi:hypothetical protein